MKQRVSPPKQTGGGGYSYEDYVGSYYALHLLQGSPPFIPGHGRLVTIQFHNEAYGWYLDDQLFITEHGQRYAASVKSGPQITSKRVDADFVKRCWKQFINKGSNVFQPETDHLVLIVPLHPDPPKHDIQSLLWKACEQGVQLHSRILKPGYASECERNLYESFSCPPALKEKHCVESEMTAELLKHVIVKEFDFLDTASEWEKNAVVICRGLLASGDGSEAIKLWHSLLAIVNKARIAGGYLDRKKLLDNLRFLYQLKDFPEYSSDWNNIRNWSEENICVVSDVIGGKVKLARDKEVNEITDNFKEKNVVVLLGESGVGKSVLAKKYAETKDITILWFDANQLSTEGLVGLNNRLCLMYQPSELFENYTQPEGLIILDGLGRLNTPSHFQELAKLFNACNLTSISSPWKIIVTCQAAHWERIRLSLLHQGFGIDAWKSLNVDVPALTEFDVVLKEFPSLKHLFYRDHLQQLLRNLKILDILACAVQSGQTFKKVQLTGESDLIAWWWTDFERRVGAGPSTLVKKLAQQQADAGVFNTPSTFLDSSEAQFLDHLQQHNIIRKSDEQITFYHDIYADWARLRCIMAQANNDVQYLQQRASNPHWNRAIRLYGLFLLERRGAESWQQALERLEPSRNLLLEALIFSAQPLTLLEKLWPVLSQNNCELLRKLLKRFLYIATFPNPNLVKTAQDLGCEDLSFARLEERIPNPIYWSPILTFLHKHKTEVIETVLLELAQIANKWLRFTDSNWPYREKASECALAVGEYVYKLNQSPLYTTNNEALKEGYAAALAAVEELPDQVIDLALRACARKFTDDVESGKVGHYKKPGTVVKMPHSLMQNGHYPKSWPDGPFFEVDRHFQEVCLKTRALEPLMRNKPDVVREIVLALLIKEPRPTYPGRHFGSDLDAEIEINDRQNLYPPFYNQGPFLLFLKHDAAYGLETILRLVNFYTERLIEMNSSPEEQRGLDIEVDGKNKRFIGNGTVFYWYRGLNFCSKAVASALMALEKWLYDCIDNGKPIENVLTRILKQGNSLSFIGLLCDVGRRKPELFKSVLRPLLSKVEIYCLAKGYEFDAGADNLVIGITYSGSVYHKLAHEWHQLPHRRHQILSIALQLYFSEPEIKEFFKQCRVSWERQLQDETISGELSEEIKKLLVLFEKNNWKATKEKNGNIIIECQFPEDMQQQRDIALQKSSKTMHALSFPYKCQEIINGEQVLDEDKLDSFFADIRDFANNSADNGEFSETRCVEDCICGGIAVLIKCHPGWLKAHPTHAQWCKEQVLDISHNLPIGSYSYTELAYNSCKCDHFISQVVPVLWAEEPDVREWRACIAELVGGYHYNAVRALMCSAYEAREKLGEDWERLVHLLLEWAVIRYEIRDDFQKKNTTRLENQWKETKQKFIEKQLPASIPLWGEEVIRGFDSDIANRGPRINLLLIQYAFNNILYLSDAKNKAERAQWIDFWSQALVCIIKPLEKYTNSDEETSTPHAPGRWVMARIAYLILEMKPEEKPEMFWKQILELGPACHYWIENFFQSWFQFGLAKDWGNSFIRHWQSMIKFVEELESWNKESGRHCFHARELRCHMFGIDYFTVRIWESQHQEIVQQMQSYYKVFAEADLLHAYSAKQFIRWLKTAAAAEIRVEAIIWLKDAVEKTSDYRWGEHDCLERLAELLDVVWQNNQIKLKQNSKAHHTFQSLLKMLTDMHNPLALDLEQRIVSR